MSSPIGLLLPEPRLASATGSDLLLDRPLALEADGPEKSLRIPRQQAETLLASLPRSATGSAGEPTPFFRLRLAPQRREIEKEGYRLAVSREGIDITASSPSGLFYGVGTLSQWLRLNSRADGAQPERIPGLVVEDGPAFTHRGVLLDISRNKVPTMETLHSIVDLLAGCKVNQLQLYMEHTFAYSGHESVWQGWSPMTATEVRSLDEYCRSRFIDLVPSQQSFGHMHRWLAHPRYRPLAECPAGVEHPFSRQVEPFSLCPTDPGSLELLEDLYAQLLPNFSSGLFNVGLDETLDLGLGRSAHACAERGKHLVYLDYLAEVRDLAARHGRRIQFWSDIILERPEIIDRIPEDAIALDWGYEADHPFEKETRKLADSGRDFYVCPGTSSWNSFAGRAENAVANLANAARWGLANGAVGYLVTDWGDNGHIQPLVASYLGFLAGASFAWQPEAARTRSALWHSLLDIHAFGVPDCGLGAATMALADVYLDSGTPSRNGTALFHLVMSPDDSLAHPRYEGLSPTGLEAVRSTIESVQLNLRSVRRGTGLDAPIRELAWAASAIDLGVSIGLARSSAGLDRPLAAVGPAAREEIRERARAVSEELPTIWRMHAREGGLSATRGRLEDLDRQL